AGDLVAVRADAVVAQARLQVVAPETAVPDGPRRIGVAPRDLHGGAVRGPFLGAFQVKRERLPVAQLEVVLPAITAQQGGELRIPYPVVVAFLAQAHAQHALPHRVDVVGTGEGIGLLAAEGPGGGHPGAGVVFPIDVAVVEGQRKMLAGRPAVTQRAGEGMLAVAVVIAVMVAIGGVRAGGAVSVAVGHAGRERVVPAAGRAREAGGAAHRAVRAHAQVGPGRERAAAVALARDDVDHAADGVGAIQAAGGTAQDLDPFDAGGVHVHPVG